MRKLLSLSLCALGLLLSSCVTVPNTKTASVSGDISDGAIWAETLTDRTGELSLNELLDLLAPQKERTCVPKGHWDENDSSQWVIDFPVCADDQKNGKAITLPARAGAIIQSAEDWGKNKTALEEACRELGSRCSFEVKKAISRMGAL